MTDLIQLHLDAIEALQAELEDRIKKALGDISPEEILARADELPQEIADELSNWIEQYMLNRLVRESARFLADMEDEEFTVDEERVRSGVLLLLEHYKSTVATLATAAFTEIQNQAALQQNMGRALDKIVAELKDATAGLGARYSAFQRSLVVTTDSFVSSAGGVVVLTGVTGALTWITVLDTKVCGDCDKRHGVTQSAQEWIDLGLPRSGWSVCTGFCRCILVPTSAFVIKGSPGPVVRGRRK